VSQVQRGVPDSFEETGRVVRVERNYVEVALVPTEGCAHCGASSLCNWTGKRERVVRARDPIGAEVGQIVVISRSRSRSLFSTVLIFGLPAGLMCAGVLLGAVLFNELLAVLFAGVGLILGVVVLKLIDARCGAGIPVVVRKLSNSPQGGKDDENSGLFCNDAGAGDGSR